AGDVIGAETGVCRRPAIRCRAVIGQRALDLRARHRGGPDRPLAVDGEGVRRARHEPVLDLVDRDLPTIDSRRRAVDRHAARHRARIDVLVVGVLLVVGHHGSLVSRDCSSCLIYERDQLPPRDHREGAAALLRARHTRGRPAVPADPLTDRWRTLHRPNPLSLSGMRLYNGDGGPRNRTWRCGFGDRNAAGERTTARSLSRRTWRCGHGDRVVLTIFDGYAGCSTPRVVRSMSTARGNERTLSASMRSKAHLDVAEARRSCAGKSGPWRTASRHFELVVGRRSAALLAGWSFSAGKHLRLLGRALVLGEDALVLQRGELLQLRDGVGRWRRRLLRDGGRFGLLALLLALPTVCLSARHSVAHRRRRPGDDGDASGSAKQSRHDDPLDQWASDASATRKPSRPSFPGGRF